MTSSAARRPVKMEDVARVAGVSPKTVSRVVNGEARVSRETANAVHAAIKELGYVLNASARSLRRGSSRTIGLIVEDIAEPIQALVTRTISETVAQNSRLLVAASSLFSVERERALVSDLVERQVDGLIVIATADDQRHLATLSESGPPVVFVDRPPREHQADAVTADNYGGALLGVQHLLDLGHRRIAFLTGRRDTWTGSERLRAYHDALRIRGIPVDPTLEIEGVPRGREWAENVNSLRRAEDPPTAVFCASSAVSAALLRSLGDEANTLAIVGFDDLPFADLLRRPLTTVAQDPVAIGTAAARLLLDRLGGNDSPAQRIQIGCQLIVRQTEPPKNDHSQSTSNRPPIRSVGGS